MSSPYQLAVIGSSGGYAGCEFASVYAALGSRVSLVEQHKDLLPGWDEMAGAHLCEVLEAAGVNVVLNQRLEIPGTGGPADRLAFTLESGETILPDLTLAATGRKPNVEGLGLESLGTGIGSDSSIPVNDKMRLGFENVFAIGDVNGIALLDSVAFAQARTAIQTILGKPARFNLRSVPRCVHTDPPVAMTGWTEQEARCAGYDVEVISETLRLMSADDRSVINPESTKIKLIVHAGDKPRVLGCLAIGLHAAEIVNLVATAIKTDVLATQLADVSLVHPSAVEALIRVLQNRFGW